MHLIKPLGQQVVKMFLDAAFKRNVNAVVGLTHGPAGCSSESAGFHCVATWLSALPGVEPFKPTRRVLPEPSRNLTGNLPIWIMLFPDLGGSGGKVCPQQLVS